jgi:tetratricopeptide (TPR) repeat protein
MLIRRFCVPAFLLISIPVAFLPCAQARPAANTFPDQDRSALTSEETQARDALNQGVTAFKNGQYDEAARLFERAKQLDSRLLNARLYLATTYAAQYIPGAPSEQNQRLGHSAIEEYKALLRLDPQNVSAIDGAGSIIFQMAGTPFNRDAFLESKSYFQKHIEIQPDDPEPYYWVGVIDWTLSFRGNAELRERFNQQGRKQIHDTDPLPPDVRTEYTKEFGPMIDEGIEALQHAIRLRPEYDDAMAYLNLLYRRKADTVATAGERERLEKMADDLLDQIMKVKQERAKSSQH